MSDRATVTYDQLIDLYDRSLVRPAVEKTIRDAWAEAEASDDVMLPGTSAEELEQQLRSSFDDHVDLTRASPEELAEIEAMKNVFRDIRGKKLSELPRPTPEEDVAEIDEETETSVAHICSSWMSLLHLTINRRTGQSDLQLDEQLLPVRPPVADWAEKCGVAAGLMREQVLEVHGKMAAELTKLTEGSEAVDLPGDLQIEWADGCWYLVPRP